MNLQFPLLLLLMQLPQESFIFDHNGGMGDLHHGVELLKRSLSSQCKRARLTRTGQQRFSYR